MTGSPLRRHWALEPGLIFLNHGSFGACPRAVLDAQSALRAELEANPVAFLGRQLDERLARARAGVGAFVGAHPDDLAFLPNATHGVDTVLRNLALAPGDEIVSNDHEYNAALNAARARAAEVGARVVVVPIPLPVASPDAVADAILGAVTPRTRLVLVSHVTSPTALVLPVAALAAALEPRGIPLLVDGAHAPGMLPLDLAALGASYYTGNLHKWCCAPKGAAFLHVRRDRQAGFRPLAISHGANDPRTAPSRFRIEFDWTGTADPTPFLAAPAALEAVGSMVAGGWPAVMAANHALAVEGRGIVRRALADAGVPGAPAPIAPAAMVGSMASIALPSGRVLAPTQDADPVQAILRERFGIEVPVLTWPREGDEGTARVRLVRISAHLHNSPDDYHALGAALGEVLAQGD